MRVGMGYDVHKLVEGRDLIMGGVKIDYEKGLLGHSDADVLLHAISDALLGAAALGDIGKHFPDTDPKYKGADSLKLLEHVAALLEENSFVVGNVDVYERDGVYQIIVTDIQPLGAGAMHKGIEQLKEKLSKANYENSR